MNWPIQMRHFLCSLLIVSSLQATEQVAGTPNRDEVEFKFAFKNRAGLKLNRLAQDLQRFVRRLTEQRQFHFPKLIESEYSMLGSFSSFIFKDYYLDTAERKLLERKSAYRLRYRWVHESRYAYYRFLPFVKSFYPDRLEVQFKSGYVYEPEKQFWKVRESRFEFRNQSAPFALKKDAPPPPWPVDEYLGVARSGRYKNYFMQPAFELKRYMQSELEQLKLATVAEVVTTRYRHHLSMRHPWGNGPNPDQVFILTIDVVRSKQLEFVEIEIEIDRNTSKEIFLLAENSGRVGLLSNRAKKALLHDLELISRVVLERLAPKYQLERLPPQFKYQRIMLSEAK